MTSIFDYINTDADSDNFTYYTVNELNNRVDEVNEREREARENQLIMIVHELNDVYASLCDTYEKKIIPTLPLCDRMVNQIEYIQRMKTLSINQQIDYGIKDDLQRYDELNLLYHRFKINSLKLPYVTAEEVNVYNIRNFINWQRKNEQRRDHAIQALLDQQQRIIKLLQSKDDVEEHVDPLFAGQCVYATDPIDKTNSALIERDVRDIE